MKKSAKEALEKADNLLDSNVLEHLETVSGFTKASLTGTGGVLKYFKIISKNSKKIVAQEHNMSCAAACIRQLAKDNGIELLEKYVREVAKTTENYGTFVDRIGPSLKLILKNKNVTFGHAFHPTLTSKEILKIFSQNESWLAVVKPVGGIEHTIIIDKIIDNSVYIRDPWPIDGFKKGTNGVEAIIKIEDMVLAWERAGQYFAKIN